MNPKSKQHNPDFIEAIIIFLMAVLPFG